MKDVLRYSPKAANRSTTRRHYKKWRRENGIPDRCDNNACQFHIGLPEWQGKPLALILDHKNGNNRDNNPKNLRYLCPNCDAQQPTRGGANQGRVENATENTFDLVERDGRRNHVIIPEPAQLSIKDIHPKYIVAWTIQRSQTKIKP